MRAVEIGTATAGSRTRGDFSNHDTSGYLLLQGKDCDLAAVAVADGMGGLEAPALASQVGVAWALATAMISDKPNEHRALQMALRAHEAVLDIAAGRNLGATLTCLLISADHVYYSHLGDTRLYWFSPTRSSCLTRDHTRLAEYLNVKNVEQRHAGSNGMARNLTRSLGDRSLLVSQIELGMVAETGDFGQDERLMICSDGLWTELAAGEMKEIVLGLAPQAAATRLVSLALDRDPTDDVTAVLVQIR